MNVENKIVEVLKTGIRAHTHTHECTDPFANWFPQKDLPSAMPPLHLHVGEVESQVC